MFRGRDCYLPGSLDDMAHDEPLSWLQVAYVRRAFQPLGRSLSLGTHARRFTPRAVWRETLQLL